MSDWLIAFREGLSERGYVEGQNTRRQRAQAVIQLASPLFAAHRETILSLLAKARLPQLLAFPRLRHVTPRRY
jgi:hypothetical protein